MASRLSGLLPEQLQAASASLFDRLRTLPEWKSVLARSGTARSHPDGRPEKSGVMLYMPGNDEPDVLPLAGEVSGLARLALPRVTDWRQSTMDAAWVENIDGPPAGNMETTRHGIRQPSPACPAADIAQIDLCVVPGRAFDKLCNRLGRGGGFYDVFLRRAVFAGPHGRAPQRPVLVGVCFDEQVVERVPTDEFDVPLDIVVTPTTIYRR